MQDNRIPEKKLTLQFYISPQAPDTLMLMSVAKAVQVLRVEDTSLSKLMVVAQPVWTSVEDPLVHFTVIGTGDGNDLLPYTGNLLIADTTVGNQQPGVPGTVVRKYVPYKHPTRQQLEPHDISRAARMIGFKSEMLIGREGERQEVGGGYVTTTYTLPITTSQVIEQLRLIEQSPEDDDVHMNMDVDTLTLKNMAAERWPLDQLDCNIAGGIEIIANAIDRGEKFDYVWRCMQRAVQENFYKPGEEDYDFNDGGRYTVNDLGLVSDYAETWKRQCWYQLAHYVTKVGEGSKPSRRLTITEHFMRVRYLLEKGTVGGITWAQRPVVKPYGNLTLSILSENGTHFEKTYTLPRPRDNFEVSQSMFASGLPEDFQNSMRELPTVFDQYALELIMAVTKDADRAELMPFVGYESQCAISYTFNGR